MAEIESMSMNANMHQIGMREKTLLKTYLEVDMNEFLQQKMDSELFEGVDESQKAQFVGNFFHFVKCRFQDCNLVQTKSKINMKKKSEEQTTTQKAKMVTNTANEVAKELEKEKADELIKPHAVADSEKDTEPTNVQLKAEIKKWKTKIENTRMNDEKLTL